MGSFLPTLCSTFITHPQMNTIVLIKEAFNNLWASIAESNWSKVLIIVFVIIGIVEGIVIVKLFLRLEVAQAREAVYSQEKANITRDGQAKVDSVVRLRFEDKEIALLEKQKIIDAFTRTKAETDSLVQQFKKNKAALEKNTVTNNKESQALTEQLKKARK